MTQPTSLKPKLRFPEFRDGTTWKSDLLGNLAEMRSGGTPLSSVPEFYGGNIPWVSIADMTKAGKYITSTGRNLSRAGLENCAAEVFPIGTVIFAMYASIGECGIAKVPLCSSQAILGIRPSGHLSNEFLYYYLSLLKPHLKSLGQHGTQANLNKGIVQNLRVPLPHSAEQQKIAECLSTLDELIGAESQKLDALKAHKKGLMQQLFPREGETLPRLRFPEFRRAGKWEKKRVDELGDVLAGKALAVNAPGTLRPYLRTKNVLDGVIDLSDVLSMPMTDAEFSRFEILDGDILLNEGQSLELVGRASIYRGEFKGRCAMQNQLLRFRAFPETSREFAAQVFRKCQRDGTFADISTKTTSIAHLGSSRFSALELAWPEPAEQHRIATCLSSLDELIAAQSDRLSALQTHKQGLLQQLFPSPVETSS